MKTHHCCTLALAFLACRTTLASPPEEAKTNVLEAISSQHMPDLKAARYTGPEESFWSEFSRQMYLDNVEVIGDRVGYPAAVSLAFQSINQGYGWNETRNHLGARAIKSLIGGDFRDAYFMTYWNHKTDDASQGLSTRSSLESLYGTEFWYAHHPYGWIPHFDQNLIRTTPYLSLESNIGRQPDRLPIAYADVRCYTDLEDFQHLGQLKLAARMIIPVDHIFQLTLGVTDYPLEAGSHWTEIVKIERPIGRGVISLVGRMNDQRESLIGQLTISF